jgi:serine/threonine-protein kinase PpkA
MSGTEFNLDLQKLPGYRIKGVLGQGGMATVYLAEQINLGREVALKVMAPHYAAAPGFAERFLAEGRITARLNHPNIVTVHDVGQHSGIYYLAAELLPGGTLRERLPQLSNLVDKLRVLRGIARGLGYAHEHKIVHRDVKPVNIMFRDEAQPVVTDFGIAKSLDASHVFTQAGGIIGTPQYMSPEQAQGLTLDGRSDLYALGIMMYEVLVGHVPFDAPDPLPILFMHVQQTPPELPEEFAQLQPVLDRLLAKLPEQRYQKAGDFAAALEPFLGKLKTGRITVVPGPGGKVLADETLRIADPIAAAKPVIAAPAPPAAPAPAPYLSSQREEVLRQLNPHPQAVKPSTAKPSTAKPVMFTAIASLVVLAALFGMFWKSPQIASTGELAQAERATRPTVFSAAAPRSAKQEIIAQVQQLMLEGALIAPEQDCAFALVQRLLEQSPTDSEALNMLREIGKALTTQVQDRWRAGQRPEALTLLRSGLAKMPNDAELNRLRADLQIDIERRPVPAAVSGVNNVQSIEELLERAEALYANSQLSTPPGDNAIEMLQLILQRTPSHAKAQAMLEKIAGDYERVALVWQARGRPDQALAQVRNGLKAAPKNSRLRKLELDLMGR